MPLPHIMLGIAALTHNLHLNLCRAIHTILCLPFGIALGLAILRKLPIQTDLAIWILALYWGAGIIVLDRVWEKIHLLFRVLVFLPLISLAIFAFFAPVSGLIWNPQTPMVTVEGIDNPVPVVVYGHANLPPKLRNSLPSITHSWADFLGQDAATLQPLAIPGLVGNDDYWSNDAFLVRQGLQRHLLQVG